MSIATAIKRVKLIEQITQLTQENFVKMTQSVATRRTQFRAVSKRDKLKANTEEENKKKVVRSFNLIQSIIDFI